MAVGVIYDLPGTSLDQYDKMLSRMGYENGGVCAPGALLHWVAASDDGVRAVDVWESRDAFDHFVQNQILPVAQEMRMRPPHVATYDIHCMLTRSPSYA